jgi:protein RecA
MTSISSKKIKDVIDEINSKFGRVIKSGSELLDRVSKTIPVSPAHDLGLGGGIPQGSWVTVAGKPKTHKTSTILHFARNCQKEGMEVYYGNIEGRLKKRDIRLDNLDMSRFHVIESSEEKLLTAVDYLTIFEDLLKTKKEILLIIDSVSMLADEKEIEGGIGTSTRGGGAKYLAQFCRNMAGVVPVRNHIVVGIMQLMANTSGYGSPFQEKGGNAIVYQADVRMQVKSTELIESDKQVVGAKVDWKINASALNTPPGQEYESYIKYGSGIDEVMELATLGEVLGLITKGGAWYTVDVLPDKPKFQGLEKLKTFLEGDKKLCQILRNKIKELI